MATSDPFTCLDCGREVVWTTSSKGTRYLATIKRWSGEDTYAERVYYPGHRCVPDGERERREQERENLLAALAESGTIVKGMRVIVARGRKVPKGTTGIVVWIGDDAYGGQRCGVKDDAGATHWTALGNLDPCLTTLEA